jgi:multicomponent Na+:H+ antiporter subunit C
MLLTAIVISFGVTAFLLAMAWRSFVLTGDDLVEDDREDRRIAREDRAAAAASDEEVADTELGEVARRAAEQGTDPEVVTDHAFLEGSSRWVAEPTEPDDGGGGQ